MSRHALMRRVIVPSPHIAFSLPRSAPVLPSFTALCVALRPSPIAPLPSSPRFEAGVFPSDNPPPTGVAPAVHPSAFVAMPPGRVAIASAARRLLFTVARGEVSRLAATMPLPHLRDAAQKPNPSAAPDSTPAATAVADAHARDVRVASAACLLAVGDYPPAWTLRRRLLLQTLACGRFHSDDTEGVGDCLAEREELRRERAFVALVLSAWPGAAAAWAHLAGLAAASPTEAVGVCGAEIGGDNAADGSVGDWAVCDRAARAKPANYYAWVHRGRLLCAATGGGGPDGRAVAVREVAYARAFVERHVGDSSGWHYLRRALVAAAAVGGNERRGGDGGGGTSRLTSGTPVTYLRSRAAALAPLVWTRKSPAGCLLSVTGSPPCAAALACISAWQCTPAFWHSHQWRGEP